MKILISNDDGFDSPGLKALAKAMTKYGEVIVAAPLKQQSGVSSSLTFTSPLNVIETNIDGIKYYLINGTPVDCVKLAINRLLDEKPDIVLSGINLGRNTAINVLYSGTIGAAIEGYLLGINSAALSINSHIDSEFIDEVAGLAGEIIEKYLINKYYDKSILLNINIPNLPKSKINGVKITHIAPTKWDEVYEERIAPYGWKYFWFAGQFEYKDNDLNSDDGALKNDYISVSPIKIDFCNYDLLDELKKI